ncbi:phage tail domain-containing protein [Furfurilactobacillus curtus]|uniref:Siphovirus-type tail component RIFT-related domain-containing protein n=1 Tax=Furfurilactobacillus curtus TaxID=1746200 RepID=A0ABQ5JMK1_9LACO
MYGKLYIKKQDEPEFEINDVLSSVKMLGIDNSAPQITPSYLESAGSDGQLLQNVTYNTSTVTVHLFARAIDIQDLKLTAARVYSLISSRTPIRIRDDIEPGKVAYVVAEPFEIQPLNHTNDSTIDIQFDNVSGMWYSLVNSDEIANSPDALQIGLQLPEQLPSYHFNENEFNIFNPSDLNIDPYRQRHTLKITIKGAGQFELENKTNGTSFKCTHSMTNTDEFVLDGVHAFLNGQLDSLETDYGHIVLNKGNNDIVITGLNNVDVTFSFPFIYLQ